MTLRRVATLLCLLGAACTGGPPRPTATAQPTGLNLEVLYPLADTELEMGQRLHVIAALTDGAGEPPPESQVAIIVRDPSGDVQAEIRATGDAQGVYRSPAWVVPHRTPSGTWTLEISADAPGKHAAAVASVQILPSTSEALLERYGFWVDAPTLGGIVPTLAGEFGDARNGRIVWGGTRPGIHILPAAWLEVQWRKGERSLADEEDVRSFFSDDLGQFGFTPIRAIGPITPTRSQTWTAWRVHGRGQVAQEQVEWIVFYAPQVGKTFAIGTTIVQPPPGVDAASVLRDGFELVPGIRPEGLAPSPLPDLLPAPDRLAPPLDTPFVGDEPIVLSWTWQRPLADDEVFEVRVDYNYAEANPRAVFHTRETQLRLPASLFAEPNCGVFNWRVRVLRPDSAPVEASAVSYDSLYAFLRWSPAAGESLPYPRLCPNAQV